MATTLLRSHPSISTSHVLPSTPTIITTQTQKSSSPNHPLNHKHIIPFRSNFAIKVAEHSSSSIGHQNHEDATITQIKTQINKTLQGINRGIFGIPTEKKCEIDDLVMMLETLNPNPNPTVELDKLGGCWKLIYSTITILGSKRTKLGLRDFISLGDFLQIIDVAKLMNMFRKNYDVLLGIFNPDGWLEITYVDETLRIGRDDKGNMFILERSNDT